MPTGYTDQIKIDTPFSEWAMKCARAFGALIMMRDDSADAPIPQEFQADTSYYDRGIEAAQTRLMQLADMTNEQLAADLAKHNDEQRASRLKSHLQAVETRAKYERMLLLVNEWEPPTPDHTGMKKFMQEQITESIKFDCHDDDEFLDSCYPIFTGTPQEWRERQLAKEHQSLAYHNENRQGEIERTRQRNEWVKALRGSLSVNQ